MKSREKKTIKIKWNYIYIYMYVLYVLYIHTYIWINAVIATSASLDLLAQQFYVGVHSKTNLMRFRCFKYNAYI